MMNSRVIALRFDVFLGFLFAVFVPVLDGWYLLWGACFFYCLGAFQVCDKKDNISRAFVVQRCFFAFCDKFLFGCL